MKAMRVIGMVAVLLAVSTMAYADYYSYNGDWKSVYFKSSSGKGFYSYSGDWRTVYRVTDRSQRGAQGSAQYDNQPGPLYYYLPVMVAPGIYVYDLDSNPRGRATTFSLKGKTDPRFYFAGRKRTETPVVFVDHK